MITPTTSVFVFYFFIGHGVRYQFSTTNSKTCNYVTLLTNTIQMTKEF